jgi:hypothetical protein
MVRKAGDSGELATMLSVVAAVVAGVLLLGCTECLVGRGSLPRSWILIGGLMSVGLAVGYAVSGKHPTMLAGAAFLNAILLTGLIPIGMQMGITGKMPCFVFRVLAQFRFGGRDSNEGAELA